MRASLLHHANFSVSSLSVEKAQPLDLVLSADGAICPQAHFAHETRVPPWMITRMLLYFMIQCDLSVPCTKVVCHLAISLKSSVTVEGDRAVFSEIMQIVTLAVRVLYTCNFSFVKPSARGFNALDVLGHSFVGLSSKGDGRKRIIGFMKSFKVVYKRFYGLWRFSFEELSQRKKPRVVPATGTFGWVMQPSLPKLCRQRHRAPSVERGRALLHRRRGPSRKVRFDGEEEEEEFVTLLPVVRLIRLQPEQHAVHARCGGRPHGRAGGLNTTLAATGSYVACYLS